MSKRSLSGSEGRFVPIARTSTVPADLSLSPEWASVLPRIRHHDGIMSNVGEQKNICDELVTRTAIAVNHSK